MKKLTYIAGRWQAAQDGCEFDVRNPADDSLIARVADGGASDRRPCSVKMIRRSRDHNLAIDAYTNGE